MDSNPYRKKTTGYLGGALSYGEVQQFLHKVNRPGERKCIICGNKFKSEGYHNRKCMKCKQREKNGENSLINREIHEYRTHFIQGKISRPFREEIG